MIEHPMKVKVTHVSEDSDIDMEWVDDSGMMCGVRWEDRFGPVPSVGDIFIMDTAFGSPTRGLYHTDGTVIKSPEDYQRDRDEMLARWRREAEESLEKNREKWAADIEALDPPFRDRMNRFVNENGFDAFFGYNGGGSYELYIVSQANSLYRHYQKKVAEPDEWFKWFKGLSYEEQKAEWPGMDDGHSGNTWAYCVGFAHRVALGNPI